MSKQQTSENEEKGSIKIKQQAMFPVVNLGKEYFNTCISLSFKFEITSNKKF